MFVPKVSESFARDARINVVVHGYCDADTVAFTRAEASHKRDFVFKFVFRYLFLKHFDDFGRAFYITGTPYANSYNHCFFLNILRNNFFDLLIPFYA